MKRRALLTGGGLALLGACSSPNPNLYTLAPVPGTPVPGGPRVVTLRRVSLARYLERPEIVRSTEDFRLNVEANDWWGEPVGAMISRVLAENLTQRLPGTTVFSESGAIDSDGDARVEVNVLRLDADREGTVILSAQVAVDRRQAGPQATRVVRESVAPTDRTLSAQVAASSVALGKLADSIADMLRAPAPARAAGVPVTRRR